MYKYSLARDLHGSFVASSSCDFAPHSSMIDPQKESYCTHNIIKVSKIVRIKCRYVYVL